MILFTHSPDGAVTFIVTKGRPQAAWGGARLEKGLIKKSLIDGGYAHSPGVQLASANAYTLQKFLISHFEHAIYFMPTTVQSYVRT